MIRRHGQYGRAASRMVAARCLQRRRTHEAPYGFKSRFENRQRHQFRRLIARSARGAAFHMALSLMLGQAGLTPERIETAQK